MISSGNIQGDKQDEKHIHVHSIIQDHKRRWQVRLNVGQTHLFGESVVQRHSMSLILYKVTRKLTLLSRWSPRRSTDMSTSAIGFIHSRLHENLKGPYLCKLRPIGTSSILTWRSSRIVMGSEIHFIMHVIELNCPDSKGNAYNQRGGIYIYVYRGLQYMIVPACLT